MNIILSILAICFIMHTTKPIYAQSYFICQQASSVANITSDIQPSTEVSRTNIGRPGKRGPPGLPGPPGVCDTGKVMELENELVNLKEQQQALATTLTIIKEKLECSGGIIFEEFCYKLAYTSGSPTTYSKALNCCVYKGGNLATIWSLPMYNTLYEYVQREWNVLIDNPTLDYIQVWLNMLYTNGELTFQEDGQKSSFVQWYHSYPRSNAGHSSIALTVAIRGSREKGETGIFNTDPSSAIAVPLCRFNMNH